jgi:ribulose-phosphate 3-epimerase
MQVRIVPSILSADLARLGEDVQAAQAGSADRIQVDVMDGVFVPNITFGPLVVDAVRRSAPDAFIEAHLMIVEPGRHVESFIKAGADLVIVHVEATAHLHRVLQQIKDAGAQAAAALNPATPLAAVEDVIADLDLLLVMTVNPGWGGQQFIRSSLGRLRRARQMIDAANPGCALEVDGGIYGRPGNNTALEVVQAGADTLVAGSAVYGHPGGVAAGIAALRDAVKPASVLQ